MRAGRPHFTKLWVSCLAPRNKHQSAMSCRGWPFASRYLQPCRVVTRPIVPFELDDAFLDDFQLLGELVACLE